MNTIDLLGRKKRDEKPEREELLVRSGDGQVTGVTRIGALIDDQTFKQILLLIEQRGFHEKSDRTGLVHIYLLGGDLPAGYTIAGSRNKD